MAGSGLPVLVKFVITLSVACIICIIGYKYFVRSTLIGLLLNGKVHNEKRITAVNDTTLVKHLDLNT